MSANNRSFVDRITFLLISILHFTRQVIDISKEGKTGLVMGCAAALPFFTAPLLLGFTTFFSRVHFHFIVLYHIVSKTDERPAFETIERFRFHMKNVALKTFLSTDSLVSSYIFALYCTLNKNIYVRSFERY